MKKLMLASAALAAAVACLAPVDPGTPISELGGEVRGPGESVVTIPQGALSKALSIRVSAASPALPVHLQRSGGAVLLAPEGTTFAKPVTVTLPVAGVAADADVKIATAPEGSDQFTLLPSTRSGNLVSAQTSHFSVFVAVVVHDTSTFDGFCWAYFQALGERAAACRGGTAAIWNTFSSRDRFCFTTSRSVADGRATFDAAAGADCLAAAKSATCDTAALGPLPSTYCPSVLKGTVLAGQTCFDNIDCHPWGRCNTLEQCPAVCEDASLGTPCGNFICAAPNVCLDGTCKAPPEEGAPCTDTVQCAFGQFCEKGGCTRRRNSGPCPTFYECSFDTLCIDGQCRPPKFIGGSCRVGTRDCGDQVPCVDGVCTDWARIGEPCDDGPAMRYCIDGYCDSLKQGPGTCRPWAKEGEQCPLGKQCCGPLTWVHDADGTCRSELCLPP